MLKQIAWNTFKNTGNINTFMELMEVDKVMQNAKDNEKNKSNEFMGQEGKKEKWEL